MAWLVALVVLVATSTGCGLIGLGVGTAAGALTPRYEMLEPTEAGLARAAPSAHLRVRTVGGSESDEWAEGDYAGIRGGALSLSNDAEVRTIPLPTVKEARVQNGNYMARGLWIGATIGGALDTAIVGLIAAVCAGQGGCGWGGR